MTVRVYEMDRKLISSPSYGNVMAMPFVAEQNFLATSDGTGRSSAFGATTNMIVVQADEDIRIKIGPDMPEADSNSYRLPANTDVAIWVTPGHKIAAKLA